MIRRTFLKALCASPLGFLIPKKEESSDYDPVKALAKGKVDTFKGFRFIIMKRAPVVDFRWFS